MDRDRLKDVQKSDLTNERLNEDFVVWLKTKGPSWLLLILVAVVAYLFIVNWKQREVNYRNEAWLAYSEAQLPTSLEDVAAQYPDVDSIAQQARLRAAASYLRSVQLSEAIGSTPEAPIPLSQEDRTFNLNRAGALYQDVLDSDTGTTGEAVIIFTSINGLAAVAESKGDLEQASSLYLKASERVSNDFPHLAKRAQHRAETTSHYDRLVVIPETIPEDPSLEALELTPLTSPVESDQPTSVEDLTTIISLPKTPVPETQEPTPVVDPADETEPEDPGSTP